MPGPSIAFVAGATGITGRHVVQELLARGVRTVAHVRPGSPTGDAWVTRFSELGAEVSRAAWTTAALEAELGALLPTHVFCLIGTTAARRRADPESTYEAVDLGLTRMLLGALDPASCQRFVFLSSTGAQAGGPGAYLRVRHEAEQAVSESPIASTIGRSSWIRDAERREPLWVRAAGSGVDAALALLSLLGARRTASRYSSIQALELAQGLVHAGFNYTTIGRILEMEELRVGRANDRAFYEPASQRDTERWS